VAEVGTVELRTSEGTSFELGVAVGISEPVTVAVTVAVTVVELRVCEGSPKPSEVVAVAVGSP